MTYEELTYRVTERGMRYKVNREGGARILGSPAVDFIILHAEDMSEIQRNAQEYRDACRASDA